MLCEMNSFLNCFGKINDKTKVFFILCLGAIGSIWAKCILIIYLEHRIYGYSFDDKDLIINTVDITYLFIFILGSVALSYGYKTSQKNYLIPWNLLKFTENFLIIAGSLEMKIKSIDYNGLFLLGFAAIVFNMLTCLWVYRTYRRCLQKEFVRHLRQIEENLDDVEVTTLERHATHNDINAVKLQIKENNLRMFIHKPTSEIKMANKLYSVNQEQKEDINTYTNNLLSKIPTIK